MDFGQALKAVREGYRCTREGWNGKGMWIELHLPPTKMSKELPYIEMKTVEGSLVPWVASQTDLLATDWRDV